MELKGKKINVLGDSITEGVGTSGPEHQYVNLLAAATGATVRNYGISGTRIARQTVPSTTPSFDGDYVARAKQMDKDADIVVVFGGTNDYGHGDAALGDDDSRDPYTFYGAMHLLCQELIANYPAGQIVFMTPLHRLEENRLVNEYGVRNQTNLAGYCAIIRHVCMTYGIPVLDLYATAGMNPTIPCNMENYLPDGLHPNDEGNRILADKLEKFLRAL